jgi:two-component system, response regulator PdtaR
MLTDDVLVVEDEFLIAQMLASMVEDMGLAVCGSAATAEEAIALAVEHRPGFVLMDVRLRGGTDGVEAAIAIHRRVGSRVIFITGSREPQTVARIKADHPFAILYKPIMFAPLRQALQQG